MVFLELFVDEGELLDKYQHLLSKKGMPDVTNLVNMDSAQWLDFTQQARVMSETLYRQLLGEQVRGEDNETER